MRQAAGITHKTEYLTDQGTIDHTYIYITQWKLGGMIAPSGGCSPGRFTCPLVTVRRARRFAQEEERARALAAAPFQARRAPVVLLEHAAEPRDEIEVEGHLEEENTRGKHEPDAQGLVRAPSYSDGQQSTSP